MVTDCQKTLTDLNEKIEQNPTDAWAIAHRGETYKLMQCYPEALTNFNQAIEMKPNYSWAIAHRGETYYLLKEYWRAIEDFTQAIELDPKYSRAIAYRGVSYFRLGQEYYPQAIADLNIAIELKPDYAWALAYRCFIYELMGRYAQGLVDFDRTVALDPTIFNPWRSKRGMILTYLRDYTQAIEWGNKALQANPDDYLAYYCIAVAKTRSQGLIESQPDIDRARQAVLTALENRLLHNDALYRLAGLAALEGNTEEALKHLQAAIPLEGEALDLARHDTAWQNLRTDGRFQDLIT
jgi:tetratricopeptide (TPR) repeat protein